jgi:hypothetical protein
VIFIFISCSSTENLTDRDVIGEYRIKSYSKGYSTIDLRENNSFEYNWRTIGLIGGTNYGVWRREGNKIILNSDFQNDYNIIRTDNINSDSIKIKVFYADDNMPLPELNCFLKSNTKITNTAFTNHEGIAIFPKVEADSLEIYFTGLKTIRHKLDKKATYYEFAMKNDDFYEYFTEAVWIFKNRKLYNSKRKKYIKF